MPQHVTTLPAHSRVLRANGARHTEQTDPSRGAAPPTWMTVSQAAARAQCGRKSIYDAVKNGRLRAARIGRKSFRFRPDWVDAWLESTAPLTDVALRA